MLDTLVLALNCIINMHNFNSLCLEIKKALLKQKVAKLHFPNCYNLQVLILKLWIVLWRYNPDLTAKSENALSSSH